MDKKGFTLIEVVMTVFILGLIATVFLPSTLMSYNNIKKAEEISIGITMAQKKIDVNIENARDSMYQYNKDNSKPNPFGSKKFALFGKEVKGVFMEEPIYNEKEKEQHGYIYAFVGNIHMEDFEKGLLPEAYDVTNRDNNGEIKPLYYMDSNKTKAYLVGDYKIKNDYYMEIKRWYVSKDGFEGFIPDTDVNEDYIGKRYPLWPNDYEVISNENYFGDTRTQLDDLERFINKHIVFSVIPVTVSGKYGYEIKSNEIYIMGPPVLGSNLKFHFDPYTLRDNNNVLYLDDTPIVNNKYIKDYSINKSFKLTITGGSMSLSYDDGRAAVYNNTQVRIDHDPITTNSFTIFLVYKNTFAENATQNIIKRSDKNNNGWEIALNDNKIGFTINSTNNSKRINQIGDGNTNEKYIITARMQSGNMKLIVDVVIL